MPRPWTRALVSGVAAVVLVGLWPAIPARAAVPVVVLDGTGYGHGVGLSQWGAEHLARTGHDASQILTTFYPGAELGRGGGTVSVAVLQAPAGATMLTFPQGGEIRSPRDGTQAPGFPLRVAPGERVRVSFDGAYRVDRLVRAQGAGDVTPYEQDPCALLVVCSTPTTPSSTTTTTTAPASTTTTAPRRSGGGGSTAGGSGGTSDPPSTSARSTSPLWAVPTGGGVTTLDDRGRSYRGTVEVTGGAALRLVNHLGVEDYLRGMAEVPGSWPAAAVQAQAVAARTYALRAMQGGGELCDDARCQVYVGRTAESAGQDAAVAASAGQVLRYRGALAAAVVAADAGGVSATSLEGFGTPDGVFPYLTTVHYETDNPFPWRVEVSLGDVAARLGYPGALTGVAVARTGPSGRALDVVLRGAAGDVHVDGLRFARSLGLRSTRFTARIGSADGAPPPPPPAGDVIQALPDDVAALVALPTRAPRETSFDRRLSAFTASASGIAGAAGPDRGLVGLAVSTALAGVVGACLPLLLRRPITLASLRGYRRARPRRCDTSL